MKSFIDISYGELPEQKLDVYMPDEGREFPVFIYFHGGGLEAGNKSHMTPMCKTLTDNNVAVVSVGYRLYPKAKYPEFILDCAMAVAWTKKNIGEYFTPTKIIVGGSSAGGYISMMLCFYKRWLLTYGVKLSDIAAFVHDAGQPTCHFNVLRERGMDTRAVVVNDMAPLYHITDKETYPDMLIIVSDNDMQNRYEQTMLLASTLRHFGHENFELKVMNGKHCHYVHKVDDNQDNVFAKLVLEFLNK